MRVGVREVQVNCDGRTLTVCSGPRRRNPIRGAGDEQGSRISGQVGPHLNVLVCDRDLRIGWEVGERRDVRNKVIGAIGGYPIPGGNRIRVGEDYRSGCLAGKGAQQVMSHLLRRRMHKRPVWRWRSDFSRKVVQTPIPLHGAGGEHLRTIAGSVDSHKGMSKIRIVRERRTGQSHRPASWARAVDTVSSGTIPRAINFITQ